MIKRLPLLSWPLLKNNPTRQLSIVLGVFGLLLTISLFYPFREVFSGRWKVNQTINLFYIDHISIGSWHQPIGQINIRFYAVCILLGLILGYFLALSLSKKHYIANTIVDRMLIGLVVFGVLGARLFYVLFNLDFFKDRPLDFILGISEGGMAIFGSIFAGLFYIWIYCKRFRFKMNEFLDFLAPSFLLGQIFGRFGNFFNYEAYGPATSVYWKMYVPEISNFYTDLNQQYFHPTFLYEIIPNFFLLIFLLWNYQNFTKRHIGLIFASYCIGYGLIRFFTEFFRLDALEIPILEVSFAGLQIQSLLVSQLCALGLFIFGLVTFNKRKKIIYLKRSMNELAIH